MNALKAFVANFGDGVFIARVFAYIGGTVCTVISALLGLYAILSPVIAIAVASNFGAGKAFIALLMAPAAAVMAVIFFATATDLFDKGDGW